MSVRSLSPEVIWNHFEDLNAVPRPSKKEERVIAFMKEFGKKLELETYEDPAGNVIIKKPATPGMEDRQTVILQGHLDMVHQKNAETDFDFDTQGIQSYIDGEWVKAKGTTLGADNGMGVAAAMSILSSKDIPHPAIEALFTIDEETGMTGAFELEQGILEGTILLNLDTEDDDEFSIGCAGGIDTNTSYHYTPESPKGTFAYNITVKGLKGGHSGMDIHLERGNANKIMNRLIAEGQDYGVQIAEINGGSLRNAIPRESFATVVVNSEDFAEAVDLASEEIKDEFAISDGGLKIEITKCDIPAEVMSIDETNKLIQAIFAVHNGVYRMSMAIEGLVETSSSLARVIVKDGSFKTLSLQRSSVESSKMDVAHTVGSAFALMGCEVEHTGSYPGWAPNPDSTILKTMEPIYKKMFNEDPDIKACHAGLECGILNERYPGLDMISFGPTIRNPHSPDEMVNIKSVEKFWNFLLEVLKETPKR
ncbi:aminoacyl-histidine dipeptidase [Parvicella tangerina]|uniref:Cytosol non-specific dipeptidase n=1 Tax=Parvicella tangerina TaxID=2829795 RepID=A0A916NIR1_9FLAO|nr:aminoacyl-histidine dipeptidase [Parvicella tangerina]CAG5085649.1 Cytosol non-specific dipeptidase [Parvicella tangerina]